MKQYINKYWTDALGLGLIFTGVLYFLKLAISNGWLPVELRIALSTALGLLGLYLGYRDYLGQRLVRGQVFAGMGASVLYGTIGYLSFTEGINWSTGALIVSMGLLNLAVSVLAFRQDMRILYLISLIGGMVTPFFIEAVHTMDLPLFIYMLILNISALIAASYKQWTETKVISLLGSMALYAVYYVLFDPEQWTKPFFYVTSIFVVYVLGLLYASYKRDKDYDGIDLLLGVLNGIHFVFWTVLILRDFEMPHAGPLMVLGLVFMAMSAFVFLTTDMRLTVAMGVYALLGAAVMAISGHEMGQLYIEGGVHHIISASIWLVLITSLYAFARHLRIPALAYGTMIPFVFLVSHWYTVAWDVEWITVFGIKYIPFLNAGALIWIGMAALAFSYARYMMSVPINSLPRPTREAGSKALGLLAHILVGGLLTIQIINVWEAYDIGFIRADVILSLCWFIYALVLFFYGARTGQRLFSVSGAIVLIISTLKVFLWDIQGESTLPKVGLLIVLGGLTMMISRVRSRVKQVPLGLDTETTSDDAGGRSV